MWEPEPGWYALPGGPAPRPSASGGRRSATGRSSSSDSARPAATSRASCPTRAHCAYWRREADVCRPASPQRTAGLCSAAGRGRGGRRRHHDHPRVGGGRRRQRSVRGDGARPVRRARPAATEVPGARPAARPARSHRAQRRRVADAGAHHRGRRGRPPVVTARRRSSTCSTRCRRCLSTAIRRTPTCLDAGGTTPWRSTGPPSASGRSAATSGTTLLAAREDFEPLLDAYLLGLPAGVATRDDVVLGARVTAVYTALGRAEWALARVAGGEGALAGKYRHPAVAPHLRALQRPSPRSRRLLGG